MVVLEQAEVFLNVRFLSVILQWTPLGFKIKDPDTLDDISKERFQGTVLKAIFKNMTKIKKELGEEGEEGGQTLNRQVLKTLQES